VSRDQEKENERRKKGRKEGPVSVEFSDEMRWKTGFDVETIHVGGNDVVNETTTTEIGQCKVGKSW